MSVSNVVPSFAIIAGEEAFVHNLDTIVKNINYLESQRNFPNYDLELERNRGWLMTSLIRYPKRTTEYILESTRFFQKTSLYMKEVFKALSSVTSSRSCAYCSFCKAELHRVGIFPERGFFGYSTPLYKKAAELGHEKAKIRYEENRRAIEAYGWLNTPYADPCRPMYEQNAILTLWELISVGRYELSSHLLNLLEARHDWKKIFQLLKMLHQQLPDNVHVTFYYKEYRKNYLFKRLFHSLWQILFLLFSASQINYIINYYYYGYHNTLHDTLCVLVIVLWPIWFFFTKTRLVFTFLGSLIGSRPCNNNWDILIDYMILSSLL